MIGLAAQRSTVLFCGGRTMNYDVIIIGAGPGGIFSAYELTHRAPALRVLTFVRQFSSTEVLHATAKRAQRRGFLGGACGLRNFELAPPKGFLSLQTETKSQPKSNTKKHSTELLHQER